MSVSTSEILFKKYYGSVTTASGTTAQAETPANARPNIYLSQFFNQPIPPVAPSILTSNAGNATTWGYRVTNTIKYMSFLVV